MIKNKPNDVWLIAVTAGKWQVHGIKEAQAAGLKVLAIDKDTNAEGLTIADQSICIDTDDWDTVIESIKNFKHNFQGAVSFCSEAGMLLAAKIREEFSFSGLSVKQTNFVINKGVQRQKWEKTNVPSVNFEIIHKNKFSLNTIKKIGFPLIIKPVDSSGSRGVSKINDEHDGLKEKFNKACDFSKSGEVIVEEFIEGDEYTVEMFFSNIPYLLAITKKKKVSGTNGTVAYELATVKLPKKTYELIEMSVINAFKFLEYKEGPGHAEIILRKDGSISIVEVAGRGGGFMVFDKFIPIVSGFNIAKATALQSVALDCGKIEISRKHGVLRFFPSKKGKLLKITGIKDANLLNGVEAEAFAEIGENYSTPLTDGDRLGYIITFDNDLKIAKKLADDAERNIKFVF